MTRGAKIQRPLWSSTTVENPAYPDLLYAENLVGPNTISALSDVTITVLEDHGALARTVDNGLDDAEAILQTVTKVGVDLDDVGRTVEANAVSACSRSYDELLSSLAGDM